MFKSASAVAFRLGARRFRGYAFGAGACLLGAVAYASIQNRAQCETTAEGKWTDIKQRVTTNYNNRIRDYSSPEKVFSVFASVSKDGKLYMTQDDFVNAVIPQQFNPNERPPGQKREMSTAFKIADQNGDGLISFEEYLFFVTLLSIPEKSFQIAFKMMDENGDGTVDQNEFKKLIGFLRKTNPHVSQTKSESSGVAQGWIDHYFGTGTGGTLKLETFGKFLKQLQSDVLKMEFELYDRDRKGYVSQKEFGLLLVAYAQAQHFPDFLNRAKSLLNVPLEHVFSFDQFANFNRLLEQLDDVETIMRVYQVNNRPFRKRDLQRLTQILCPSQLNQAVIDTIMHVFDKDQNGSLEIDEFVSVLRRRKYRGFGQERELGFTNTMGCIWQCVKGEP